MDAHAHDETRRPVGKRRPEGDLELIETKPVAVVGSLGHRKAGHHAAVVVIMTAAVGLMAAASDAAPRLLSHLPLRVRVVNATVASLAVCLAVRLAWRVAMVIALLASARRRFALRIDASLAVCVSELPSSALKRGCYRIGVNDVDAGAWARQRRPKRLGGLREFLIGSAADDEQVGIGAAFRLWPAAAAKQLLRGESLPCRPGGAEHEHMRPLRRQAQEWRRQVHRNAPSRQA